MGKQRQVDLCAKLSKKLLSESPDVTIRFTTREAAHESKVWAGGQFDMAVVTDNETVIRDIAGLELYVEPLRSDRFVVVGNPPARASWSRAWDALPVRPSGDR